MSEGGAIDGITAEEAKITDLDYWKDLVKDLRRDYKELQITSKEIEGQLEQMLEDAQEEAERSLKDLTFYKDENDKLNKANEKLLYEYKKLKDKYSTEVREVEQETDKNKEEFEKLKQKYKDLNEKLVALEIDNEDLERRNQAYESAIENCEEKIDSLLEEIALTQSERDDTKTWLTEQIEKLNQQLEELQIDLEYKEKQIKKYKFLHLLHDYPTSASEILSKAANANKVPERSSTLLPSSTRNKTSEEFGFFNRNRALVQRKSDVVFGPQKPSLSIFADMNPSPEKARTDEELAESSLSAHDPFSSEIKDIIQRQKESRVRRNSTDIWCFPKNRDGDLYHGTQREGKSATAAIRGNSADLVLSRHPPRVESASAKLPESQQIDDFDRHTITQVKNPDDVKPKEAVKIEERPVTESLEHQKSNPFSAVSEAPASAKPSADDAKPEQITARQTIIENTTDQKVKPGKSTN